MEEPDPDNHEMAQDDPLDDDWQPGQQNSKKLKHVGKKQPRQQPTTNAGQFRSPKPRKISNKPRKIDHNLTEWCDFPDWRGKQHLVCLLLTLPGELIDAILGSEILNLRDHPALAATNRVFRSLDYTPIDPTETGRVTTSNLWSTLLVLRPPPNCTRGNLVSSSRAAQEHKALVHHIWTSSGRTRVDDMVVLFPLNAPPLGRDIDVNTDKKGREQDVAIIPVAGEAVHSRQWKIAIELVNNDSFLTEETAISNYRLSQNQLNDVVYGLSDLNPYSHRVCKVRLYLEAAVESHALRCHGGYFDHSEHVHRRKQAADKARQTRRANKIQETLSNQINLF
ncbi:hypothetical protein OIO90_002891 [Microbotryomycetes sp. JL221]|nr:hypothetical protein OIO90_002891 [Microbotryomycetes sp. JL221]